MFEVPESVRDLRTKVLRFVEDECYPTEAAFQRLPAGPTDLMRGLAEKAKERGLWALGHPVEYGGGGLSFVDYSFICEVVGRSEVANFALGTATLQTAKLLELRAGPEWKQRLLPGLVAGEFEVAFAVTEPDVASSDPTQLATRAALEGDEWVLNGRKWCISLLNWSRYVIVMARSEDESAAAHRRFSMFLVPMGTPGLRLVREVITDHALSDHWEIELDDCRIPADHILGERGEGFVQSQERLGPGRIYHCMRTLGMAQRAFDMMCARANARILSGRPLADKQLTRLAAYRSYQEIQACRLMVLDAAEKLDRGEQARVELSAIKVECTRMVGRVVDRAVQIHGAYGLFDENPLSRMGGRELRIADGPDEAHIDRVGRLLLKAYAGGGPGWDFAR
ncbi:acyl-CoA dehydrogenase family protein [Pseudonocardia sp.]|uniref:acyl-CoA dehydrogenase family protein n=1 Tax=Pseudonocardia sp. TaxID=60912 RepID=UPI003D11A834